MITGLKCKRCSHEWVPRGSGTPKVCPKCKSPYWDTERRVKVSPLPIPTPSLDEMMAVNDELVEQGKGGWK